MKILQLGAGSMGARRLRDLSAHGDIELALYDVHEGRREIAQKRWENLQVFDDKQKAFDWEPDALSISTPPDHHEEYIKYALDKGIHHFSEANIWTYNHDEVLAISKEKGIISAPSSSLLFVPVIQELRRIVSTELGNLHSYQMMLSTYMPGWHPGEGDDYYARKRSTVAGREMVAFELGGLSPIFGFPKSVLGLVGRRGKLKVDSEDIWCLQMLLENGAFGQLTVLMASPGERRRGICVGDNGVVEFDVMTGDIKRDLPGIGISDTRNFGAQLTVVEEAYAREIDAFVNAILGTAEWPYDYAASASATNAIASAEISSLIGRAVLTDLSVQPGIVPTDYSVIAG